MTEDEQEVARIREIVDAVDRSDYASVAVLLDCAGASGDVLQGALHAAFIRSVRPLLRTLASLPSGDSSK